MTGLFRGLWLLIKIAFWVAVAGLTMVMPLVGLVVIGVLVVVHFYEAEAKRDREIDAMLAERRAGGDQR